MKIQSLSRVVFPPRCLGCGGSVGSAPGLCVRCWSDAPFIFGARCDACGAALNGQVAGRGERLICDGCRTAPPPWHIGRAVFSYEGTARRLILGLKHGDRTDIAAAVGPWLARSGSDCFANHPVLLPIPLHWQRRVGRRYNQAALLSSALSKITGLQSRPMVLRRPRNTGSQAGRTRAERQRALEGAIILPTREAARLRARPVVLIDDVMTTGATLAAATRACQAAGVGEIRVLTLARASGEAYITRNGSADRRKPDGIG